MPKRPGGDDSPLAERLTVSLRADLRAFVGTEWRRHRKLDGQLADNVSQYVADLVERDRQAKLRAANVNED